MSPTVQIFQFAKWPHKGRVKTRLAATLGDDGALHAHVTLTLTVLEQLRLCGYPLALAWDHDLDEPPAEAGPILNAVAGYGIGQLIQQGRDLGERMTQALSRGLQEADRAIVVGSDCPSVDADYVDQAVAALEEADVVFGPSDDGGYVLIGARRTTPGMLREVAWGSETALEESVAAVSNAGLSVATLAPRWDVDEPEDWARFLSEFGQSPTGG
ncbi:TIGR04282 family arsenosugar biosynthesis glycosyltransferase [Marinobacter sp. OP 3.4]|uniref:TIGR04282 family arsenosugar biosynthesis glycosyltransferase n=1 Tax=Marinobacter sp. OP 3.4 TaxID=3076501 RepID=UPI002E2071EC